MKHLCIILLLASLVSPVQSQQKIRKDLTQGWEFSQYGLNEWLPAGVPGTVQTDLMSNGKIRDPYYGMEERNVQWIDKVDWTYRTRFDVEPAWLASNRAELVFEGLDTYADVSLNGKTILEGDNMFLAYRLNVKELLKETGNELVITFRSPIREGLKKQAAYGIRLPAINDQSETGQIGKNQVSIFTRKAGYHYGWDWGPRLVPSGIWRPAYLEFWNTARITDVFVSTVSLTDKSAKMHAEVTIEAESPAFCTLNLTAGSTSWLRENVVLVKGTNVFTRDFEVKNPKLWWPLDYGEPYLYQVTAGLSDTSKVLSELQIPVGIRTLRLVQNPDPDGNGKSFYFEVNGVPVFAKGANYIPNDVFLPRVTPEEYEKVVGSAAFAHMNMLRVWGGGIYENDLFYDLCDRYGILIWQDFMFACSMYPGTPDFLSSVTEEARQNIIRLRKHPCMALWCGNNEMEAAWGPYDEKMGWGWKNLYTQEQREMIWHAYDTVFHSILPEAVGRLNPLTPYWHSSPSGGMGILATNETRTGDNHYWGVWHQKHPFSDFNRYISRFMSEYGFQSFPEFDAVKKYTQPADWDIESPVMSSHQRSGIGNVRIREYMALDYNIPQDFSNFLYVSHLLQAEGIKTGIEAHRRNKPYCMGTLYWQLNDCWPVASWSGTDYYRNYKALHYFARKAYEPVVPNSYRNGDTVEFCVISDRNVRLKGTLRIRTITFDGQTVFTQDLPFRTEPLGISAKTRIPVSQLSGGKNLNSLVVITSIVADGVNASENILYLVKPKDLDLPEANINMRILEDSGNWIINLTSAKLAKNVMVTWQGRAGIFSDNYFDLIPGKQVSIRLPKTLCRQNPEKEIQLLTLRDAR
jgi:beta-mannosidase